MKNNLAVLIIFFLVWGTVSAQNNQTNDLGVKITHSVHEGKVWLRWGPSNVEAWSLGRTHGYVLEKKTIRENGRFLENPKVELLNNGLFIPVKETVWEEKIHSNDYAAIIAQAFYGNSFEVDGSSGKHNISVLNQVKDRNDRFVFSLLAADLNFEAAVLAGWGFQDNSVKPDGIYDYTVWLNLPGNAPPVKTTVRVFPASDTKLPVPFDVKAQFDDKSVMIIWNKRFDKGVYTYYRVERSVDGKTFSPLNDKPLFFIENEEMVSETGSYNDSIPNNQLFHYRVVGVDCFGTEGPPSRSVSGFARRKLKAIPRLTNHIFTEYGKADLFWEFDPKEEDLIKGFEIWFSDDALTGYVPVAKALLPDQRKANVNVFNFSHFLIKAIAFDSTFTYSGPYSVMRPDLVPPHKPASPKGKIDSLGILVLEWEPNKDDDLAGYFIYYKFSEQMAWAQANNDPIAGCSFTDSVNLRLGPEGIWFSVRAVDQAYNHSEYADAVRIKIPDILKPAKPIISASSQNSDTIHLSWMRSISDDVVRQIVLRKTEKQEKWVPVAEFAENTTCSFSDWGLEEGKEYCYALKAIDDDGLESDLSDMVSFRIPFYKKPAKVEKFNGHFDQQGMKIILKWKNDKTVLGYQIFKEVDAEGAFFLGLFDPSTDNYIDNSVKPFKKYQYQIRTIGKNGNYSAFESVTLEWK